MNSLNKENFILNNIDRIEKIYNQLRIEHQNEEEIELTTELSLQFSEIFYLDGGKLTFTNEIKHCIDTF